MSRHILLVLMAFMAVCAVMGSSVFAGPENPLPSKSKAFGDLPLYFIENRGQVHGDVDYYVQGTDKMLYFTSEGITIALTSKRSRDGDMSGADKSAAERWAVKLGFVAADPCVAPKGEDRKKAVFSYFKGRRKDWKTGIPSFGRLVYQDLWPGIDLVYSGTVNRLKYAFVVKPGADPGRVRLFYQGATAVCLKENGALWVDTPLGSLEDARPCAYQETDGSRTAVSMAYDLDANSADKIFTFGFHVGEYDETRPLVLDPDMIVYCGYIGGDGDEGRDSGSTIAVDGNGYAYIAGYTNSTESTFPVVGGPDLTYNGDPDDVFVAKVEADGSGLVYCGYIGGDNGERARDIALDSLGYVYITGRTASESSSFPVQTGPYLTYSGGIFDAFVARIEPDFSGLDYCGYIGGDNEDVGYGIAVDASRNAYVVGQTDSSEDHEGFPAKVGPDTHFDSIDRNGFIAKVKFDGTELVYCGYIEGDGNDKANKVAVNGLGEAHVVGATSSDESSFPVKTGPDTTHNGEGDAFVAKLIAYPDKTNPKDNYYYCGYIGGSEKDGAQVIALNDSEENAYVSGFTRSDETTFPVKVGPDLTFNGAPGSHDAFVAKVEAGGAGLDYCGYIGGGAAEQADGIAVDYLGNLYVTGRTSSDEASFPVMVGPDLSFNGGSVDAFVAKVNPYGSHLVYCGYVGGGDFEEGYGLAVDGKGNAYITGYTESDENSFPVKVGPDLSYNGSGSVFEGDVFVAKIARYQPWYVDASAPGPIHDGLSWETAFLTIQEGIDAAEEGDPVCVESGIYKENIDFNQKDITVEGAGSSGIPIIDPGGLGSAVTFSGGEGPDAVLDGFRITNGNATSGGGIDCNNADPTIMNNFIYGNSALVGGGIACSNSWPSVLNNTICNNSATNKGGGIYCLNSSPAIKNTIVWNNDPEQIFVVSGSPTVSYSLVEGGWTGQTNLYGDSSDDPMFTGGDYHLTWKSSCINRGTDAGAPLRDIDGVTRPCMGTVDIGADEFTDTHSLEADVFVIQGVSGGSVDFTLNAKTENGNRSYIILGSLSGTNPGTPLPGGAATLPINWDFYTNVVILYANSPFFVNFIGVLLSDGSGIAAFNSMVPIPDLIGFTMSYAYALNKPWDFASNPINIKVE